MKNTTVTCRFNGVDAQLVDEIAFVAGRKADSVAQAHPATLDKKGVRVVTVVTHECESAKAAEVLMKLLAPVAGVEVFAA